MFFNKLFGNKIEKKSSVNSVITKSIRDAVNNIDGTKGPKPIGSDYISLSKNAYLNTVSVYYCTSLIAQKAGTVPIRLIKKDVKNEKGTEVFSSPVLDLVKNPNNYMDWQSYLEHMITYYLIDGNAYHKPIVIDDKVHQIQVYKPSEVELIRDSDDSQPNSYRVTVSGKQKEYRVSKIDQNCEIKHMHNFNPLDQFEGISTLSSARTVIDIQNSGDNHNYNTLRNQARPSGALVYAPDDGSPQQLDDEQFDRLNDQIKDQYTGEENSGKPLLLEAGLKWVQLSMSTKDLDYINARGVSQKDVCRAFKVPPTLLGLDNDSTYNNVREARLGLWDDAIIPILKKLINHWNKFILPLFNLDEDYELVYDLADIPDLETRAKRVWERIDNVDFVTLNEKREMIGLDGIEGGDTIMISSGDIPLDLLMNGVTAGDLNEIVSAGSSKPSKDKETEESKV